MNRKSQNGVALVITLIMLAMVTVMAVLFLGISRRERASVTVTASLTDAKLAAEAGQARALSEVVARIAAQTNLSAYDYLVSTNYVNPKGFIRKNQIDLTNVSYTYPNGQLLNNDTDIRQNQGNLFYNPRAPVFVVTNFATGASDFRFYLDLNRNGRFDTNGLQRVYDTNGFPMALTNFYWGDPEWIGILEHPDQPHSPSNRFVGRYAFVVAPAGKTLDINFIHNNAKDPSLKTGQPITPGYYFRNEGVGAWEINLAAFFRELNTNIWSPASYVYVPNNAVPNGGYAFRDAYSILTNRYRSRWASLKSVNLTFGGKADNWFRSDQIDEYSDGPLMIGLKPPVEGPAGDNPLQPWSGSYNTNGYSSIQELFDPAKTSPNLTSRLQLALAGRGTYNQDTVYRLMAQLGTDSLPANRNKLNLNYVNVTNVNGTNGVIDPNLATSFTAWTPLGFFTNAASRLLAARYPVSFPAADRIQIQVYPPTTNQYSADVHRMLQLAANIADATTNRFLLSAGTNRIYAPSVFRPLFTRRADGAIFITGYDEVTNAAQVLSPTNLWVDLKLTNNALDGTLAIRTDSGVNVYGIPLVIGAKKGLPNFNEFLLESSVEVTRRLQGVKDRAGSTNVTFQQTYEIGISNYCALEAWNSYTQACPFPVDMILTNRISLTLSNEASLPYVVSPARLKTTNVVTSVTATLPAGTWDGNQFQVPLKHLEIFVPDQEFHFQPPPAHLEPVRPTISFDGSAGFPVPNWKLYVTNRIVFALVAKDLANNPRIVDFVNIDNLAGGMDITRALVGQTNMFSEGTRDQSGLFWQTNRVTSGVNRLTAPANSTWGITNQLWVSITNILSERDWKNYSSDRDAGLDREKAIDGFRVFLGLRPIFDPANTNFPGVGGRVMQVPFTPTRKLDQQLSWQVNDPLVHYTLEDLYDPRFADTNNIQPLLPSQNPPANNIGKINSRYSRWGGNPNKAVESDPFAFDLAVKDPLIAQSDDWDFPTNRFPNLGWLGRVHRGTPWQTVYLKSSVEPAPSWKNWAGSDATHPTNDWHLVGLFTTAVNDNAARGLLSVNQTNTAAWSALLSGVCVLSNTLANARPGDPVAYSDIFIEPASWQLRSIVTNINATRLLHPGQAFPDLGSVLSAPALTVASPFLDTRVSGAQKFPLINDEMYERIPQQILSLLKEDEPYVVIYAFGQSLRPAENSVVRAPGPYRGLCTNYQVTGEVVTKTAVRIEELKLPPQQPKRYRAVVESYNILPAD